MECYYKVQCCSDLIRSVFSPDSKIHGANMGPIWVLSAPDGPHVGPSNLAIYYSHQGTPYLAHEGEVCFFNEFKVSSVFYFSYCCTLWNIHDDVIKWKLFPRYWPFVWITHRSTVNSPHKGQWRGSLMFTLICARINGWVNNREAGDLRCHHAHYDVIVTLIYWTLFLRNPIKINGHQLFSRRTRMRGCLRQYVSQYAYPGILSIANQSVTLPLDHYQWLFPNSIYPVPF